MAIPKTAEELRTMAGELGLTFRYGDAAVLASPCKIACRIL